MSTGMHIQAIFDCILFYCFDCSYFFNYVWIWYVMNKNTFVCVCVRVSKLERELCSSHSALANCQSLHLCFDVYQLLYFYSSFFFFLSYENIHGRLGKNIKNVLLVILIEWFLKLISCDCWCETKANWIVKIFAHKWK